MQPDIVFHLPRSWVGPFGTGLLPFYGVLTKGLVARGIAFELIPLDRSTVLETVAKDSAFHIINHGRFQHPRILNAGVAYIYPFWNLDPQGIRAFSSIAGQNFEPDTLDGTSARPFFRRLRQRLIGARKSRYEQPEAASADLPEAKVAVFLQSEGHRVVGETCYLDRWQMLDTVLEATDGPVIVKPHPRDKSVETQDVLLEYRARFPHLCLSDGNIHDILAVSDRVVTINSAVGVEAYLHRKPVVLCGQADFHHIANTAHTQEELAQILARPARKRTYDKYIYWYFGVQCLATTDPDLMPRFLDRMAQQN